MKAPGVLRLVVPDDRRIVLRNEAPQPNERGRLGIREMVGHLARRPAAVGAGSIEVVIGDALERLLDGGVATAVAVQ